MVLYCPLCHARFVTRNSRRGNFPTAHREKLHQLSTLLANIVDIFASPVTFFRRGSALEFFTASPLNREGTRLLYAQDTARRHLHLDGQTLIFETMFLHVDNTRESFFIHLSLRCVTSTHF